MWLFFCALLLLVLPPLLGQKIGHIKKIGHNYIIVVTWPSGNQNKFQWILKMIVYTL